VQFVVQAEHPSHFFPNLGCVCILALSELALYQVEVDEVDAG
jgi:hypothetical protein